MGDFDSDSEWVLCLFCPTVGDVWCRFCYCKDLCLICFHRSKLCRKMETPCGARMAANYLASAARWIWTKYTIKYNSIEPQGAAQSLFIRAISPSVQHTSCYFLQFLLTQPFRGSGYVAHILRFRKRASKSRRATQITAGQDSDIACGLAGIFLCISVIMELPPHARHPHYLITIWQMSVQLTGWSVSKPSSPTRLQGCWRWLCVYFLAWSF